MASRRAALVRKANAAETALSELMQMFHTRTNKKLVTTVSDGLHALDIEQARLNNGIAGILSEYEDGCSDHTLAILEALKALLGNKKPR